MWSLSDQLSCHRLSPSSPCTFNLKFVRASVKSYVIWDKSKSGISQVIVLSEQVSYQVFFWVGLVQVTCQVHCAKSEEIWDISKTNLKSSLFMASPSHFISHLGKLNKPLMKQISSQFSRTNCMTPDNSLQSLNAYHYIFISSHFALKAILSIYFSWDKAPVNVDIWIMNHDWHLRCVAQ